MKHTKQEKVTALQVSLAMDKVYADAHNLKVKKQLDKAFKIGWRWMFK
jgi:hypothetical protein